MEGRGAALRVGLLVLFGVVALAGLIVFLGGTRLGKGVYFETYFRESVQGLDVGSPVKYLGVTLGHVTDIGLVYAEYGQSQPAELQQATYREVYVRFEIDPSKVARVPNTEMAIRTGLRARLALQGITGLAYIELAFVSPTQYPAAEIPWKPEYTYLPSMPSTITQVENAAQELLAKLDTVDFKQLIDNVAGLAGTLQSDLKGGGVHAVLAQAQSLLAALQQSVQQADLPGLAAQLRDSASSVQGLAQGKQLKDLLANLSVASDHLATAADRLPPLLAALQATARRADNGTADLEASLAPILRDTAAAVANLREMTEALRQAPGQVLFSAPPPRERRTSP